MSARFKLSLTRKVQFSASFNGLINTPCRLDRVIAIDKFAIYRPLLGQLLTQGLNPIALSRVMTGGKKVYPRLSGFMNGRL